MLTAVYVRVSTQEQAEHGYSIGEQEERLKAYCSAVGWTVYKVYTDAGFSGGNINRPALQQLITDVKLGRVQKVLVYKLDRLSRSQKDTLSLIEDVFLAHGADFVSLSENFDTGTPFGRAMIGILAVFAQLEREQIKERMSMGLDARAKQGKFHGSSTVPIGYNYIGGKLEINPFEAAQIVKAHELYIAGRGILSICEELNAAGMTHKHGKWLPLTLRNVIAKRTYLGETYWRGNWYKGEHEPILSQELFDAAERLKSQKHEGYLEQGTRDGMATSYLGGLLYCAHCGAKYVKCAHYNTYKGKRDVIPLYKCDSRAKKTPSAVRDPNCRNKIWKMEELDGIIFDEISKLEFDPAFLSDATKDQPAPAVDLISAEIKKVDGQLSRLMDLYAVGEMPLDILQKKITELNERRTALEQEANNAEMTRKNAPNRAEAIKAVKGFSDILKRGNLGEIRAVIGMLIKKIELDGDDVTIYWRFD